MPDPYNIIPYRRRLDDTRIAMTHKFKITTKDGVVKGYLTVGLFPDGKVGELFIKMNGSQFNGWTNTVGILTSLALQSGIPLEVIVNKLEFQRFEPSGKTGNPNIRHAQSIIDYVFRWLGYQFVKDYKKEHAD